MKRILQGVLTLVLVFSLPTPIEAQEKSKYKCAYEVVVQKDTVNRRDEKDTYMVQINDEMTKGFYYKKFYLDSLEVANKELYDQIEDQAFANIDKYAKEGIPDAFFKAMEPLIIESQFESILYKNYTMNKMTLVEKITFMGTYTFSDELKPQDWEIQTDTMTILGYPSQKATCHFRGRNWIAWFTSEIPLSEGPWKFYGLPGLITKVEDDKEHYSFTLTGFQEISEPIDTQISKKAGKTTRENFIKIFRQEEDSKSNRNFYLDNAGVNRPQKENKREDGNVRYDYIETDYKEWGKEK